MGEDEARMGYEVVTPFLKGYKNRWHNVSCDNLFTFPKLFHDLMVVGF